MAELPGKNIRRNVTAVPSNRPVSSASSAKRRAVGPVNGGRKPTRTGTPLAIPTSYKVIGIVVLVVVLVIAFGYGPFMRYRYTSVIDSGATITERDNAANSLFQRQDGSAYGIFQARMVAADPMARDASAYGLSLFAKEGGPLAVTATDELAAAAAKLNADGKKAFAIFFQSIAKSIPKSDSDHKPSEAETKRLGVIAKALIPDLSHADASVRASAADALADVPAPGVCAALLTAAANDADAGNKIKARAGIAATALPDAAGALLQAMASADADLKSEAGAAFKKIRDKAKSEELLPLVGSPDESVRKEIVAALGKRNADSKAAEGVTAALTDASADIRKLAVKCIKVTGVSGPASKLLPLITDPDPGVRLQCADTLGELRDEDSKKVLLEAFGKNPDQETFNALADALGKRSSGKEIAAIAIVIDQMNKHPEAFAGLRGALVKLTNAGQGPTRDADRLKWDAAKWNAWFENISAREKIREEALSKLQKAEARKQEDKKFYPELSKMTNDAYEMIEKCVEMSKANDPEDVREFELIQNKYRGNKYLFEKFQVLDENRRK